jgi:hypothetical protein
MDDGSSRTNGLFLSLSIFRLSFFSVFRQSHCSKRGGISVYCDEFFLYKPPTACHCALWHSFLTLTNSKKFCLDLQRFVVPVVPPVLLSS